MNNELDTITRAGDMVGTLAGQALNIRKMGVALDNYSLAKVIERATISKGQELTQKQQQEFTSLAQEVEEWQKRAEKLQSQLDEQNEKSAKQMAFFN